MKLAMIAAALLAAGVMAPAHAQLGVIVQSDGQLQITGGYVEFCSNKYDPATCVRSAPALDQALPKPTFFVPDLNGTFSFTSFDGANSNAGTYSSQGSVTFQNGGLLSDFYDFGYARSQVGDVSARTTYVTGRVTNSSVVVTSIGSAPRVLTPVPEPAGWAMMLIGFGVIGVVVRRRAAAVSIA